MASDLMLHKRGISRRHFMMMSAATIGTGVLAACTAPVAVSPGDSGEETVAAEDVQVVMWAFPLTGDDAVLFQPIKEAFTEANPSITVEVQIEPWNGRETKMLAALAAGNAAQCGLSESGFLS